MGRQLNIPFKFSDGTMRLVEIERVQTNWYYPEDIKTGKYKFSLDEPLYILTDPYIIKLK